MAYALYRNYRPKRFSDLVGQDDVAITLRNQVSHGRVGHAYLFTGIRGTGKTTFARILAKAVNCLSVVDGEPCGECVICKGIDNGTILDITEIDGASNNGVDNIRELRDETAYVPTVAKYRVYIIDEIHMLSASAFAALLKILEEPPEHVIFILATTEIHRVPATILSRCQRFDLKRISIPIITEYLLDIAKKTGIELQEEAAVIIAQHADGAMRDALSILDTCISMGNVVDTDVVRRMFGSSENEYLFSISRAIAGEDVSQLMNQIDILYTNSLNPLSITRELLNHYRNILVSLVGNSNLLGSLDKEYVNQYTQVSKLYTLAEAIYVLKQLKDLSASLSSVVDKRLQLEISLIEIVSNLRQQPTQAIQSEVRPTAQKSQATPEKKSPLPNASPPFLVSERKVDEIKVEKEQLAKPEIKRSLSETEKEFLEWPTILEEMSKSYPLLYAFLTGSIAYITDTHVLIDCSPFAKESIRNNKGYAESIKECIYKATGINRAIGPYSPPEEETSANALDENIEDLIARATAAGIPVEVK